MAASPVPMSPIRSMYAGYTIRSLPRAEPELQAQNVPAKPTPVGASFSETRAIGVSLRHDSVSHFDGSVDRRVGAFGVGRVADSLVDHSPGDLPHPVDGEGGHVGVSSVCEGPIVDLFGALGLPLEDDLLRLPVRARDDAEPSKEIASRERVARSGSGKCHEEHVSVSPGDDGGRRPHEQRASRRQEAVIRMFALFTGHPPHMAVCAGYTRGGRASVLADGLLEQPLLAWKRELMAFHAGVVFDAALARSCSTDMARHARDTEIRLGRARPLGVGLGRVARDAKGKRLNGIRGLERVVAKRLGVVRCAPLATDVLVAVHAALVGDRRAGLSRARRDVRRRSRRSTSRDERDRGHDEPETDPRSRNSHHAPRLRRTGPRATFLPPKMRYVRNMLVRSSFFQVGVVLALAASAGCTRNDTVVAETLVLPPKASPSATLEVQRSPPEAPAPKEVPLPAPTPIVLARSEADAPKLGSACVDASLCGTKNTVAIRGYRFQGFQMRDKEPCKLVATTKNNMNVEHDSARACIAGDRVIVETDCVMCRISQGTHVEALVAELTPQQLSNVQHMAGLGVGKPLLTTSEWQSALALAAKTSPPSH